MDKNIHNYPSDDISIGGGQPGNWQDNPHFFQLGGTMAPLAPPGSGLAETLNVYWVISITKVLLKQPERFTRLLNSIYVDQL